MEVKYVAFIILVGSVFVLFVCMKGIFDVAMTKMFDPSEPIDIQDVKKAVIVASLALFLSIICWRFI